MLRSAAISVLIAATATVTALQPEQVALDVPPADSVMPSHVTRVTSEADMHRIRTTHDVVVVLLHRGPARPCDECPTVWSWFAQAASTLNPASSANGGAGGPPLSLRWATLDTDGAPDAFAYALNEQQPPPDYQLPAVLVFKYEYQAQRGKKPHLFLITDRLPSELPVFVSRLAGPPVKLTTNATDLRRRIESPFAEHITLSLWMEDATPDTMRTAFYFVADAERHRFNFVEVRRENDVEYESLPMSPEDLETFFSHTSAAYRAGLYPDGSAIVAYICADKPGDALLATANVDRAPEWPPGAVCNGGLLGQAPLLTYALRPTDDTRRMHSYYVAAISHLLDAIEGHRASPERSLTEAYKFDFEYPLTAVADADGEEADGGDFNFGGDLDQATAKSPADEAEYVRCRRGRLRPGEKALVDIVGFNARNGVKFFVSTNDEIATTDLQQLDDANPQREDLPPIIGQLVNGMCSGQTTRAIVLPPGLGYPKGKAPPRVRDTDQVVFAVKLKRVLSAGRDVPQGASHEFD